MEFIPTILTSIGALLFLLQKRTSAVMWDRADVLVSQGDDVNVTCQANITPLDVMRVFLVDGEGKEHVIADNHMLKPMFVATGRYRTEFSHDSAAATGDLTLVYSGIRGEDAGQVGCFVLGNRDSQSYVSLQVTVPIKALYIAAVDSTGYEFRVPPESNVHLRENEELGVVCVAEVNGTKTPPDMAIKVGGRDVSQEFTEEIATGSSDPDYPGLPLQSTTKRLKYQTLFPSADFNNKDLECMASLHGNDVTTTVHLQVEYSPFITCERYQYFQQTGKSITFKCELRANPGPHVQWYYGEEAENHTVEKHPAHSSISVYKETISSDHTEISLRIDKLESSHFTTYILSSSNVMGDGAATIVLEEGVVDIVTEPPPPEVVPTTTATSTDGVKYNVLSSAAPTDERTEKARVTVKDHGIHQQPSTQNACNLIGSHFVLLLNCLLLCHLATRRSS